VGDIQKERLPHPLPPFLKALRVAGWAKSSGAAREHHEPLFPTRGTADAGKPAARVAAVKIALNHLLDDGAEEAVLLLEPGLILGQESVEIMEEHPVEHGALRVTGTVNSCHSRRSFIKKRANPHRKGLLAEMTEVRQAVCSDRRPYLLTTVDAQDRDPQLLIQPQLVPPPADSGTG